MGDPMFKLPIDEEDAGRLPQGRAASVSREWTSSPLLIGMHRNTMLEARWARESRVKMRSHCLNLLC
jgi:hypothetical protein